MDFVAIKLKLNDEDDAAARELCANLYAECDSENAASLEGQALKLADSLRDDLESIELARITEFGGGRSRDTSDVESTVRAFLEAKKWDYVPGDEGELFEPRAWIKSYLDDVETALYGSQYEDSTTGYAAYADEQSFIRYHIIAEAFKNRTPTTPACSSTKNVTAF